jgi:hypothetical protein
MKPLNATSKMIEVETSRTGKERKDLLGIRPQWKSVKKDSLELLI